MVGGMGCCLGWEQNEMFTLRAAKRQVTRKQSYVVLRRTWSNKISKNRAHSQGWDRTQEWDTLSTWVMNLSYREELCLGEYPQQGTSGQRDQERRTGKRRWKEGREMIDVPRKEEARWGENGLLLEEIQGVGPRIISSMDSCCTASQPNICSCTFPKHVGAYAQLNALDPNHFHRWNEVKVWCLYTDTNKNKYNMCSAFSRSFSFKYFIFHYLNRFIPRGFYFRMCLHFNMLSLLNMNSTEQLGALESFYQWHFFCKRTDGVSSIASCLPHHF